MSFLARYMERGAEGKIKEAISGKQRPLEGIYMQFVTALAAGTGFYHLYTAYYGAPFAVLFRNIHWMLVASLLFLLYPAKRNSKAKNPQLIDWMLVLASVVICGYVWFFWGAIASRAGAPTQLDVYLGLLLIAIVVEAARRTVGWPIIIISLVFLVYAYFGRHMPGMLIHRGYSIDRISSYLYLTDAGIFGIPLGVSSRFIMLFIIFGAFLDRCGAGVFFRDLSLALTGKYTGGPAKASILFSAMIGSITGSSTANVVTTGTFTIPLMKRLGYKPAFAAGVEADGSTGGQILPPVMGAAAFVMAEFLGRPYRDIMIAAAFPAAMYFITSYYMIHYRALKEGLVGLPPEEIPSLKDTLKSGGYFFVPLVTLVIMIFQGFSLSRAVFFAIVITIGLSWLRKQTRMYPKDIYLTTAEGVKKSLEVVAACAVAGIIIGMVTMTGLGLKFSTIIVELSGGTLWVALPITMLASLFLGMGVPTTAKYIILATLVAPALVMMGAPLLSAHMFILYFGTDADITPPVGLAAYAAAGIAGSHPLETGWEALKLGLTAYIVPFLIIYSPAIMLDAPLLHLAHVLPTAILGCAILGAAIQGYFLRAMPLLHRIVAALGAILLMVPNMGFSLAGAVLVAIIYALEIYIKKDDDQQKAQVAALS